MGKKFSSVFPIDIPGTIGSRTAYAGFTASTGNATATEDILQWTYNALPSFSNGFANFGLALNGVASVAGTRLQLTDGGVNESGSAFYATPVNIQQFTSDFLFQLSNAEADGMTFVIQRAGASALGDSGGGLGYGTGIGNSVAVKFDLYNNGGEGANSTGLYINGAVPTVPSVDLASHGIDLHNGSTYHAQLSYDGSNLALTLTDASNPAATFSTAFRIDIPGTIGGTTAFVGFAGRNRRRIGRPADSHMELQFNRYVDRHAYGYGGANTQPAGRHGSQRAPIGDTRGFNTRRGDLLHNGRIDADRLFSQIFVSDSGRSGHKDQRPCGGALVHP